MHEMEIEPPQAGGEGYTSLRDTTQSADKVLARVGIFVLDLSAPSTKREFNAEADVTTPALPTSAWLNSTASAAVASFLHGPALPPEIFDVEPHRPHRPATTTETTSSRSPQSDSVVHRAGGTEENEPFDLAPTYPDPFAYLDNDDPPMINTSPPTPLSSAAPAWGSDAALLAHPLFAGDIPSHLTQPIPPHTHAYVAFGAGSRQKDVDTFTAAHPLEGGTVTYHVPLCVQKLSCKSKLILLCFG